MPLVERFKTSLVLDSRHGMRLTTFAATVAAAAAAAADAADDDDDDDATAAAEGVQDVCRFSNFKYRCNSPCILASSYSATSIVPAPRAPVSRFDLHAAAAAAPALYKSTVVRACYCEHAPLAPEIEFHTWLVT